MSYEEIDKTTVGNDVFTNGAEGRYAKPNPSKRIDNLENSMKTNEKKHFLTFKECAINFLFKNISTVYSHKRKAC